MVTVAQTSRLQTIRPQNGRNNSSRTRLIDRLLCGVALFLTVDLVYKQVISSWRNNNNNNSAEAQTSGLKAQEQTVAAATPQDAAATTKKEDAPAAENANANDADVVKKDDKPYVKFTMYMGRESKVLYGEHHCPVQEKGANDTTAARAPLDPTLQERLGFATHIETNLNVIIYGDSLGMQMAHALQEATGVLQLEELYKTADNSQALSISHTSRNAFVAAWRTTGLLSRWNENKAGPDAAGGGWNRQWAQRLRDYMASKHAVASPSSTFHMDVFVMRIPATTWIQPYMIRKQGLLESVALAHEVFGAKHVVLLTSPFTNHIQDQEMWGKLRNLNIQIRKLAASYEPHSIKGVERISVLDTAAWVEHLMQFNANLLGYSHTTLVSGGIDPDYPFGRLSCSEIDATTTQPGLLIAQSCATKVQPGECECVQNRLFVDGTHWCMETLGGRWAAGLACVMGCHYKHQDEEVVRACEQTCNDRFMSLTPAQELVSEIP